MLGMHRTRHGSPGGHRTRPPPSAAHPKDTRQCGHWQTGMLRADRTARSCSQRRRGQTGALLPGRLPPRRGPDAGSTPALPRWTPQHHPSLPGLPPQLGSCVEGGGAAPTEGPRLQHQGPALQHGPGELRLPRVCRADTHARTEPSHTCTGISTWSPQMHTCAHEINAHTHAGTSAWGCFSCTHMCAGSHRTATPVQAYMTPLHTHTENRHTPACTQDAITCAHMHRADVHIEGTITHVHAGRHRTTTRRRICSHVYACTQSQHTRAHTNRAVTHACQAMLHKPSHKGMPRAIV